MSTERDLPRLSVQTLGDFAVRRGDVRLEDGVWGREKALELFQYFLTHPGEVRRKERVAEELWPGSSATQAERDFKVALNALSDALEPERAPRSLAGYLRRQGSSYGLASDAPLELDYLLFEAGLLAAGRCEDSASAVEGFREALERYRGDYLPNRLESDWSANTRERLQSLFLTSAPRLARLLEAGGDTLEAIFWCQRVIGLDPLWEEAYRLLMRCHLSSGNRPLAVRVYQDLRQHLGASLDLEPMRETTRLYQQALEG